MKNILEIAREKFPTDWIVTKQSDENIIVRDESITKGQGYRIDIISNSVRLYAKIFFEDFALKLQQHAKEQFHNKNSCLLTIVEKQKHIRLRQYQLQYEDMPANGAMQEDSWWLVLEYRKVNANEVELERFFDVLISIVFYLLPYQAQADEEGRPDQVLLTRYERSRINRAIFLAYHGYDCKACEINLVDQYGSVAHEYIHVHHVQPLALAGPYVPDPINDMVPLCPNCHSIAHLQNPPYSVEEIRNMLNK